MTDFKTRLNAGFKALRAQGYFARQDWQCCQGCGCAAVPATKGGNYAFYHRQDSERLREAQVPNALPEDVGVYLSWEGNGSLIAVTFRAAGCDVIWDGKRSTRIWVCDKVDDDAAYRGQLEALVA